MSRKLTRARKVEIRPEGGGESRYARKVRVRRAFLEHGTWPIWVHMRETGQIKV